LAIKPDLKVLEFRVRGIFNLLIIKKKGLTALGLDADLKIRLRRRTFWGSIPVSFRLAGGVNFSNRPKPGDNRM